MGILKAFESIKKLEEYKTLTEAIKLNTSIIEVHGITETEKALIVSSLYNDTGKTCLFITHNDILAKKIYEDLSFFIEDKAKLLFSKELLFERIDAKSNEINQNRLRTINEVIMSDSCVICASIEALLTKMTSPKRFIECIRKFSIGDIVNIGELIEFFIYAGYERVEMIEGVGQFSVRGGIVDFFCPAFEYPIRVEFFDNEVDSIRSFDVFTQRSIEKLKNITISPAKELILDEDDYKRAVSNINQEISKNSKSINKDIESIALKEDIQKLSDKLYFEGIEKYTNYFFEHSYTFMDYLKDYIVIIDEPNRVKQRYENIFLEFSEEFKNNLEKGHVLQSQINSQITYDELVLRIKDRVIISMNALLKSSVDFKPNVLISFVSRPMHPFHGKISLLIDEITSFKKKSYTIIILCGTKDRAKGLLDALSQKNIEAVYKDKIEYEPVAGQVIIMPGTLNGGFEFPQIKFALVCDREVYGAKKKSVPKKRGKVLKVFSDLKVGDFVVHENHGIGQYIGIEKLKVDGITKDYLNIKYQGNDKLFIPTDQLDMIQKYIGNEDKVPKLNRLGGAEWNKVKERAKKSIESIADDLIKLYAKREQQVGFAFSKDTRWQKEFEDLFPYQETPDQLRCIEEIKESMENQRPMDRLLCGDVGYGKTEVALRAAFKAVMDGKQVAILVPTTILAQQHYNTCTQRFSNFPLNIGMLSRFKTSSEQKKTLLSLKQGNVDILIGTHRLLQKDVVFSDLGLLIIDEEQRFGVKHKERIKQIKTNVDVLTLTATPIPRTLHMSLIGIRDISIIEEPPEERYPVLTYVVEYNEELIKDAIVREISRGGQVYYLYNRVKNINKIATRLQELIPDAKIAVGHGQMSENALEETMLDFYNGEYDILVCTTIIETGLDIPNVNTIIISDSDKLGLSQLYQLRGRVGRSNRLAYAYLVYQKDKVLNEDAEKRLRAIKEFTEFGSGFKIAMRDLEIRGSGNLLGSEQHGHMEAIGYDLYIKLLEERIRQLKGEAPKVDVDTSIELGINAYIPDNYISDVGQKIEIYKKIAAIESQEDIYDIEEELEDRFGNIPDIIRNLTQISYIKLIAKKCSISSISQKEHNIILKYKSNVHVDLKAVAQIVGEYGNKILFTASEEPYFTVRCPNLKALECLSLIRNILEKISSFHEGKIHV